MAGPNESLSRLSSADFSEQMEDNFSPITEPSILSPAINASQSRAPAPSSEFSDSFHLSDESGELISNGQSLQPSVETSTSLKKTNKIWSSISTALGYDSVKCWDFQEPSELNGEYVRDGFTKKNESLKYPASAGDSDGVSAQLIEVSMPSTLSSSRKIEDWQYNWEQLPS
ncbi:hypothetical protein HDU84_006848 [Entophlyctis sp. JEL0112]|nr:hypothetical protein HDU84_006848 [Entophlyctis sp. JEL0112]